MSSVFRVVKNCNYTTLSNYHFKDKRLSWKAKGLLSTMLSLPDDWNYTIEGLASLSDDGIKATNSGLVELEKCGYLIRRQSRNNNGHFGVTEYIIFEQPVEQEGKQNDNLTEEKAEPEWNSKIDDRNSQPLCQNGQTVENTAFSPYVQKRQTEKRFAEKGVQLNTNILNTYYSSSSDTVQKEMRKNLLLDEEAEYRLRKRFELEHIAQKCSPELTEAVFAELCKREARFIQLMNAKALEQICLAITEMQRREPIRILPNMINKCLDNIMLGIKATTDENGKGINTREKNTFNCFEQNHYDFDTLEKEILSN